MSTCEKCWFGKLQFDNAVMLKALKAVWEDVKDKSYYDYLSVETLFLVKQAISQVENGEIK